MGTRECACRPRFQLAWCTGLVTSRSTIHVGENWKQAIWLCLTGTGRLIPQPSMTLLLDSYHAKTCRFRWKHLWPQLAAWFGLEAEEPLRLPMTKVSSLCCSPSHLYLFKKGVKFPLNSIFPFANHLIDAAQFTV